MQELALEMNGRGALRARIKSQRGKPTTESIFNRRLSSGASASDARKGVPETRRWRRKCCVRANDRRFPPSQARRKVTEASGAAARLKATQRAAG